ncbi:MAG: hypothetical protein ACOYBA_02465 [Coprococcus sp.]|jgi:hypothetical protein
MMIFAVLAVLTAVAVLLIFVKDNSEAEREEKAREEYMKSVEEAKKQLIPELMRSEWITSGKTPQQADEPVNGTWKEWTMTRFMKVD